MGVHSRHRKVGRYQAPTQQTVNLDKPDSDWPGESVQRLVEPSFLGMLFLGRMDVILVVNEIPNTPDELGTNPAGFRTKTGGLGDFLASAVSST